MRWPVQAGRLTYEGAIMPPAAKRAPRKTASRKTSTSSKKATSKSARPRASTLAHARHESNRRAIGRAKAALESTQKEITAIRGSLGSGRRDLRKDVAKLIKDARRDVEKMNRAVLADLERLQKGISAAAKPDRAKRAAPKTRTGARRRRGA
jgi:hypothetical protein